MSALDELSAVELAAAIARKEVGAVEVTQQALDRAAELNDRVGAFITITPELALEQARAVERAVAEADNHAQLPPLLGVPLPIKDLTQVAGVPMTAGSAALRDFVPEEDDGIVTLLRKAGTTMIGKTNTPEFGFPPYTEPDIAPPARNPWDLSRTAGGSSEGLVPPEPPATPPSPPATTAAGRSASPPGPAGRAAPSPPPGRRSP